jgi:polyhydroxybutyrate depolymerase
LIVPEALAPEPDRPPKFLTNPPRWNDGSPSPVPGRASNIDDVAFIRAVLTDAETRLALDHSRVYVTGFSNGAGMCFRLAIEASERIAAIAPVAGYCPLADDPRPRYPVPTCYLIGTADPLVPPRGGDVVIPWGNRLIRRPPIAEKLAQWAEAIGCFPDPLVEQELRTHRIDRYPSKQRDGAEFLVYLIEGLGHHWPGGKGQLNPRIGGPSVSPLHANEVIWDFFRRHTREHSPH